MALKRGRNGVTSGDDISAQNHVIFVICITLRIIATVINLPFAYYRSHHEENEIYGQAEVFMYTGKDLTSREHQLQKNINLFRSALALMC